jgi:hypothetical protein
MDGLGALLFIDGIFLGGLIFLCLLRYGLRSMGYVNDSVSGSWVIQALAYLMGVPFGLWLAAIVAVILVDEGKEAPFWLIVAFGIGCGGVLARVGLTVSWYFTEWIYARIDE